MGPLLGLTVMLAILHTCFNGTPFTPSARLFHWGNQIHRYTTMCLHPTARVCNLLAATAAACPALTSQRIRRMDIDTMSTTTNQLFHKWWASHNIYDLFRDILNVATWTSKDICSRSITDTPYRTSTRVTFLKDWSSAPEKRGRVVSELRMANTIKIFLKKFSIAHVSPILIIIKKNDGKCPVLTCSLDQKPKSVQKLQNKSWILLLCLLKGRSCFN